MGSSESPSLKTSQRDITGSVAQFVRMIVLGPTKLKNRHLTKWNEPYLCSLGVKTPMQTHSLNGGMLQ